MRTERLLRIVGLLRAHGRLSASELARRLEVSARTVMRDIEALSLAGVPVYAERGREGGYALLPGYRPDVEELTEAESRALFIAGGAGVADALGLGRDYETALRKLATGMPEGRTGQVGRALERVVIDPGGWAGRRHVPERLRELLGAVEADRRIRVVYRAVSSQWGGRRTLDPWGLVLAGQSWYLIAAHRGTPHTYRIDRFERVQVLDAAAHRPARLDLLATWQELRSSWQQQPSTAVAIRVRRDQADLARRQLGIASRGPVDVADLVADGPDHLRLTAQVSSLRGLAAVLTGFGSWAEVLDPPEARAMIRQVALEALEGHPGPVPGRPPATSSGSS